MIEVLLVIGLVAVNGGWLWYKDRSDLRAVAERRLLVNSAIARNPVEFAQRSGVSRPKAEAPAITDVPEGVYDGRSPLGL